eukprot:m51a1_g10919 hypothetical protein (142) ;mRNA; f:97860-98285
MALVVCAPPASQQHMRCISTTRVIRGRCDSLSDMPLIRKCCDDRGRVFIETTLTVHWLTADALSECKAESMAPYVVVRGPRYTTFAQAVAAAHKARGDRRPRTEMIYSQFGELLSGDMCVGDATKFRVRFATRVRASCTLL